MKFTKLAFAAVFAFAFGNAYAFHSGGVAECEGCHTMHNSLDGKAIDTFLPQFQSGVYLLKGSDQSSACLNCHQHTGDTGPSSYHISTADADMPAGKAPIQLTPGGDFGWLKKTYSYFVRGTPNTDDGETHGHNIVSADYGYTADGGKDKGVAPGGSFDVNKLACSSCHDPHGKYRRDAGGNVTTTGLPIFNSGSYATSADPIANVSAVGVYRILGGAGFAPKSYNAGAFTANPPVAVAPGSYNRSEATTQTHVAYGAGMSEWCGNCHSAMVENGYTSGMANLVHPAGNSAKLSTAIAANYNAYVSSGKMTNSDPLKAYSTLAPFEMGTSSYATLKGLAVTTDTKDQSAVAGTSNVSCLSCHRAHASGFPSMTRYFLENEFMTVTVSASDTTAAYDGTDGLNGSEGKIHFGKTMLETQQAYYGRPATVFGPYARNYCNKCHAKD